LIYLKSTELEKSVFDEPLSPSGITPVSAVPAPCGDVKSSESFSGQAGLKQAKEDLGHPDPRMRMMAARFLERADAAIAVPLLKETLSDRDPRIRTEGLRILAAHTENPALHALFQACLKDEDFRVRIAALRAIFKSRMRLDLPGLLALSGDASALVRRKLATLLGWTRDEGTLEILSVLSKDPDPKVKQAALASLLALDPYSCENRLMQAMEDPDPQVRRWAKDALEKRIAKTLTRRNIRLAERE
jgi:HEAT repeat protein